jgi:hypothetical protein
MIKGVLEYPIKINTLDTPSARPDPFVYSEKYLSLDVLEKRNKDRKQDIEAELRALLEAPIPAESETVEAPTDLDFLEGEPPKSPEFVVVHDEIKLEPNFIDSPDFFSDNPPETGEASLPPGNQIK